MRSTTGKADRIGGKVSKMASLSQDGDYAIGGNDRVAPGNVENTVGSVLIDRVAEGAMAQCFGIV